MRVYVGYRDYGFGGKSEPLIAFSDASLAHAWKNGAEASSGTKCEIVTLELYEIGGATAPPIGDKS